MEREQIIQALRRAQDAEYTKFGDMADPLLSNAANLLEQDELDILALEKFSSTTIDHANRNYGCLLLLFSLVYLSSIGGIIFYYHYTR